LAEAAAEARTMREEFDELLAKSKAELEDMTSERDSTLNVVEERDACIEALKSELSEKDIAIAALEEEKNTLLNDSVAPEEYLAMEEKAIKLEGEKNQSEKMTRSLQKDMKKVVKELQHQIWLVEEELARSNERCEELRGVMTQMADDDLKRIEEEQQSKSKSGIMGKMKNIRRMSTLGPGVN
jgi:chromosome segregation ATPase